jgi:hypothetical protein
MRFRLHKTTEGRRMIAQIALIMIFMNIFKIAPEALGLFSFKHDANLYGPGSKLERHATGHVETTVTTGKLIGKMNDSMGINPNPVFGPMFCFCFLWFYVVCFCVVYCPNFHGVYYMLYILNRKRIAIRID